jgi:hypothetical protein
LPRNSKNHPPGDCHSGAKKLLYNLAKKEYGLFGAQFKGGVK